MTEEAVKQAPDKINHHPKQVLGYNALDDVFNRALKQYRRRYQLSLSELK